MGCVEIGEPREAAADHSKGSMLPDSDGCANKGLVVPPADWDKSVMNHPFKTGGRTRGGHHVQKYWAFCALKTDISCLERLFNACIFLHY